jgi:adenylate cyclase class IV
VRAPSTEPSALREALTRGLGVLGRVRKTRTLLMIGATRVHLDRVEGLGDFLELEVVLRDNQTEADGVAVAQALLGRLGVAPSQLVRGAYLDLLLAR